MKQKLLIAGGGHSDIPLIIAAKELGYHVITTGYNPDDLGHKYSDEYHKEDFSNKEKMLVLAKKLEINAICACSNDFSAISSAYVAEELNLPGHDTYKTTRFIHHKDSFRKFAIENNILAPYGKGFNDIKTALSELDKFKLPIIVKPIDLSGGKGISKVSDISEFRKAVEDAFSLSKAKKIVIEEFIEGSRHGFSAFLKNKKIIFYFSDNEHYFLNPYMVSGASSPSIVSTKIESILISESEKIAELLSLKDGIFHIQYILSHNKPKIIEICRRSPGDFYTKFVKLATGVDYPEFIVKAEAGLNIDKLSFNKPKSFILRHCIMSDKTGIIKNLIFHDSIKANIIDEFKLLNNGDFISDIMTQKLGIIFLKFNSMKEMLEKAENLNNYINIIFEKD